MLLKTLPNRGIDTLKIHSGIAADGVIVHISASFVIKAYSINVNRVISAKFQTNFLNRSSLGQIERVYRRTAFQK